VSPTRAPATGVCRCDDGWRVEDGPRSIEDVDVHGNVKLMAAGECAGVPRIVFVSTLGV